MVSWRGRGELSHQTLDDPLRWGLKCQAGSDQDFIRFGGISKKDPRAFHRCASAVRILSAFAVSHAL